MWLLRLAAAAFGYCVAVTLSVSALLVMGWRSVVSDISASPSEFLVELSAPTALAGGLHFIAAGLLFLRRSRSRFPEVDRVRSARSAFLYGAAAWYGVTLAVVVIATAFGSDNAFHRMDPWFLTWWASGPFCFAAAAAGAESLLRATVARRELWPWETER